MPSGVYPRASLADRFWAKVNKNGPIPQHRPKLGRCWLWTGAGGAGKHGRLVVDGRLDGSHRVAFFLAHGRWPEPWCLHKCDNPPCCRPSHLFEGTAKANVHDMIQKGRRTLSVGSAHYIAKLTEASVANIRLAHQTEASSVAELAVKYHVSRAAIYRMLQGRSWKHI